MVGNEAERMAAKKKVDAMGAIRARRSSGVIRRAKSALPYPGPSRKSEITQTGHNDRLFPRMANDARHKHAPTPISRRRQKKAERKKRKQNQKKRQALSLKLYPTRTAQSRSSGRCGFSGRKKDADVVVAAISVVLTVERGILCRPPNQRPAHRHTRHKTTGEDRPRRV